MAAGTKKTDAELQAQIDAGIRTNGNKEITPPIHNSIEQNIVKSKVSKKDGGLVVDVLLGYSVALAPTDPKHFTPKKYVDDSIGILSDDYELLDGSNGPWTGDKDAGGYLINNLDKITDFSNVDSIKVNARELRNRDGIVTEYYHDCQQYDGNTPNRICTNWKLRYLYFDDNTNQSIRWNDGEFGNRSSETVARWGGSDAAFEVTSTTQGFLTPRMTTTQKLAISSPVEGLEVYDLMLHQKSYYNGTVWVNY